MAALPTTTTGTTPSQIPDSQPLSTDLDNEIATIRAQITTLTAHRSLLRSTLLTAKPTQSLLTHHINPALNGKASDAQSPSAPALTTAAKHAKQQAKHNLLNLHRLCAGATMFRVRDPDPYAPDGGRIYGVRIEVFCDGKFLPPYYLLLTRADPTTSTALRVHRHTIPPCIPLPALVAKWLPLPARGADADAVESANADLVVVKEGGRRTQRQDLGRLVRELRRELVGWHFRRACVGRLRWEVGLGVGGGEVGAGERATWRGKGGGVKVIEALDAEVMDVRVEWVDGRVGRVRVDKGGRVERAVVLGARGRERAVERGIVCGVGGAVGRLEGLGTRLLEVPAVA